MLTETTVPGSDDWWAMRLATELGAKFPRLAVLRDHLDGRAMFPAGVPPTTSQILTDLVRVHNLNFAAPIVSAVTSRQTPIGFRTAAADDDEGDSLVMAQWRASHMVTRSRDLFVDVATYGEGFTVTGAASSGPVVVKTSPWDTIVAAPPATPWMADAALTVQWDAVEGRDVATLYRPGYWRQMASAGPVSGLPGNGAVWFPGRGWDWVTDPMPTPWGSRIPVVRHAAPRGEGQFEQHLGTLGRINHTIFQRLVLIVLQAYRQRAVKGDLPQVYPADHPLAGQRVDYNDIFSSDPAALWMLPAGADIWESSVTDTGQLLNAVKDDLRHLAAASSTPLYVLSPDAASGSAQGAGLADKMLNAKVEDLNARLGESLAEAMSLVFAAKGDTARSDPAQIETLWRPAAAPSLSEKAQAASQAASTLPRKTIWRTVWGMTPTEIDQAERDMTDEQFMAVNGAEPAAVGGTAS